MTAHLFNMLQVEPIQVEAWFLEKQRKVACSLKALDHQTMDPSEFCDVIIVEGTDEIETETARTEPEVIGID